MQYSKLIKYADDTVVFFGDKDFKVIESHLNTDMHNLSAWLNENEMILNLKPGKTELLLFGTHQKLSKIPRELIVCYNHRKIHNTKSYKYLGVEINASLNLNSQFDKNYKKASSRLRLLTRLKPFLTREAARSIFSHMVMPIFMYCSLLKLKLSMTQENMLGSLERRANIIVPDHGMCFSRAMKKKACMFVRKVLIGEIEYPLNEYFSLQSSQVNTRNNNHILVLPKVKLEYCRMSTRYMAAKIFNELPLVLRKKVTDHEFKTLTEEHYSTRS